MTFGDTLRDGERLASLMEHLPLIIHAKHPVSLLLVMFNHKGQYFKTNTSVTSSILGWKYTYQLLTSTTSVTFALACRFIPGFS